MIRYDFAIIVFNNLLEPINNNNKPQFTVNVVKPSNVEPSSTTEKNQIINYVDEDDEDIDDDEDEQATSKYSKIPNLQQQQNIGQFSRINKLQLIYFQYR